MKLWNNNYSNKSVQQTINTLKKADNAIESLMCKDCKKPVGRLESINYKGNRCLTCFHDFYQKEYDITLNDNTAKYLIKCGSKSTAFKKATPEQQKYAINYFKANGYPKPSIQEMSQNTLDLEANDASNS